MITIYQLQLNICIRFFCWKKQCLNDDLIVGMLDRERNLKRSSISTVEERYQSRFSHEKVTNSNYSLMLRLPTLLYNSPNNEMAKKVSLYHVLDVYLTKLQNCTCYSKQSLCKSKCHACEFCKWKFQPSPLPPPSPFPRLLHPKFFRPLDLGRPISNEPFRPLHMITNQLKENIILGWLLYVIRSFLLVGFRFQYQLISRLAFHWPFSSEANLVPRANL